MTIDTAEAVSRLSGAVENLAHDLLGAGVAPDALAAGLRIVAGKIEFEHRPGKMRFDQQELVDLARKTHEFVNTLIAAGVDERVAIVVLGNTAAERITRTEGVGKAVAWLRGMARVVESNPQGVEIASRSH